MRARLGVQGAPAAASDARFLPPACLTPPACLQPPHPRRSLTRLAEALKVDKEGNPLPGAEAVPASSSSARPTQPCTPAPPKSAVAPATGRARRSEVAEEEPEEARGGAEARPNLVVGERLRVYWGGDRCWYQATVRKVHEDGDGGVKYDLVYDDGDTWEAWDLNDERRARPASRPALTLLPALH